MAGDKSSLEDVVLLSEGDGLDDKVGGRRYVLAQRMNQINAGIAICGLELAKTSLAAEVCLLSIFGDLNSEQSAKFYLAIGEAEERIFELCDNIKRYQRRIYNMKRN